MFIYLIIDQNKSVYRYTRRSNRWIIQKSLIRNINRGKCSTKWYKELHLEFNAFGVNHFEKVMFLMDDLYRTVIRNRIYRCIFFEFGKIDPRTIPFSHASIDKKVRIFN